MKLTDTIKVIDFENKVIYGSCKAGDLKRSGNLTQKGRPKDKNRQVKI